MYLPVFYPNLEGKDVPGSTRKGQHEVTLRNITKRTAFRFVATDRLELPAKGHTNKTPSPDVLGWWPSSAREINDFLTELQEVWLIIARGSYEAQDLCEGYGLGVCRRG
jgi:hypothetical protein